MCTDEQKQQELFALQKIAQLLDSRTPEDKTVLVNDNQPWTVDYHNFKHIFLWLPQQLTLVLGEYGSGTVQAQVWINLALRPGTLLKTSGTASATPIILRFTDEVVP